MNFSLLNYTNVTTNDIIGSCDVAERDTLTPEYWDIVLDDPGDYARLPLYLFIFITGIPLNIFIIARVVYKRLYKQSTFILLLSLAICDLLVCLIPIFNNIIINFVGQRSFGSTDYIRCQLCKIAVFFIILNFISTFSLALISLDRFIYFKFSINYDMICSRNKVLVAVISVWVISILLGIPPLAGIGDLVFASSCGLVFLTPTHLRRGIPYIGIAILVHTIVFIILVVTNVWVLIIGCKQLHKNKVKPIGSQAGYDLEMRLARKERAIFRKQLKLLQIFGGILGIHFVTLIPAMVLIAVLSFTGSIPSALYTFVLFSVSSQATLHPLMESFFTPELRKLVTKCCRRGKPVKRASLMEQEL